ncbi:MAG TPA: hypothetical protein VGC15_05745 [Acetobacteraceae bacterium]
MAQRIASWRRLAVLATAAGLAACQQPKSIVLTPQAPPPNVDGRYRGTVRLVRAESRSCPPSGPRVLAISNGSVTLSYSGDAPRSRTPLTASIAPDGRIQASDGVGAMDGRLSDGQLGITISSRTCEHRWTLSKVE